MDNCESDVSQMQLGKPLLKRNKELETQIKEYKFKAAEQECKIVHLKQRCVELEKQLTMQENQADSSAHQKMMTMHMQLSPPEDVRQGLMCSRCLRNINEYINNLDKISDDDERSMLTDSTYEFSHSEIEDSIRKPGDNLELNTIKSSNPNRDLVAIYEALLEVQRTSIAPKTLVGAKETSNLNSPEPQQKQKRNIVTSSKKSVTKKTLTATARDKLIPSVVFGAVKEESPIMSSQSIAISECVKKLKSKTSKQQILSVSSSVKPASKQGSSIWEPSSMEPIVENVGVLTPLKREPLEYMAVGIKKKNRRKHRNQITQNRVDLLDFRDNASRKSPLGQESASAPFNENFAPSSSMISNQKVSYAKVLRRAD